MSYTKALERAKFQALSFADGNYAESTPVPKSLRPNLIRFRNNIHLSRSSIRQFAFQREIFSDASKSGWGASYKDDSVHGVWNKEENPGAINRLDLAAAF